MSTLKEAVSKCGTVTAYFFTITVIAFALYYIPLYTFGYSEIFHMMDVVGTIAMLLFVGSMLAMILITAILGIKAFIARKERG